MAKLKGLKLSESEVSQTIDLVELFGPKIRGQSALQQAIGQAIIDQIIERTKSGVSVNGRPLAKYKKEYVESDEFRAFNKSEGDVNMTLTGQMLGTLDVIESGRGKVKIGWSDETENAKAYNHNTGDTVRKRQFFGVNQSELQSIVERFRPEVEALGERLQTPERQTVASLLQQLSAGGFEITGGLGNEE